MNKLTVHYKGWGEHWPLGTLADNGRQLLFEYSPEALKQGLELSPRHLKLSAQTYGGFPAHLMRLPGLIADSLPDGWGLLLMDKLFRQQGRASAAMTPLERLAFIGDRAMGALSYEPATSEYPLLPQDIQLLDLAQQARSVISGHESSALRQLAAMGGSPQGARPKVLVHYTPGSGQIGTQASPGSEPWLIKFQAQGEHKEACALEDLYAHMARQCGLDMPATHHFDIDRNLAAFGIARFDLSHGQRVPIHSLAGLLHADFRLPSSVDYTTFLRATRALTQDEREVSKAFERSVFNVILNNRDDHSKNFAYRLAQDRRWQLAPCYDLTYNEGPGGEHQMDICGQGRHITRAHLLRLAQQADLSPGWAKQVIDRIADQATQFKTHAKQWPVRRTTVSRLHATIMANVGLMKP